MAERPTWLPVAPGTLPSPDASVLVLSGADAVSTTGAVLHRYVALYGAADRLQWRLADGN